MALSEACDCLESQVQYYALSLLSPGGTFDVRHFERPTIILCSKLSTPCYAHWTHCDPHCRDLSAGDVATLGWEARPLTQTPGQWCVTTEASNTV